jgi:hypothetical protein
MLSSKEQKNREHHLTPTHPRRLWEQPLEGLKTKEAFFLWSIEPYMTWSRSTTLNHQTGHSYLKRISSRIAGEGIKPHLQPPQIKVAAIMCSTMRILPSSTPNNPSNLWHHSCTALQPTVSQYPHEKPRYMRDPDIENWLQESSAYWPTRMVEAQQSENLHPETNLSFSTCTSPSWKQCRHLENSSAHSVSPQMRVLSIRTSTLEGSGLFTLCLQNQRVSEVTRKAFGYLEVTCFIDRKYKDHMVTCIKSLIQFGLIVAMCSPQSPLYR